jgi:hypothetical protein
MQDIEPGQNVIIPHQSVPSEQAALWNILAVGEDMLAEALGQRSLTFPLSSIF